MDTGVEKDKMVYRFVIVFLCCPIHIHGHGYLKDPPQRSSLWRIYPGHFPPNYNDNALNCGGLQHQWRFNEGRCGLCGDPFDDIRQHENGGLYDKGFITRNYTSGSNIFLTVRITSNHRGWFEFKVCSLDQTHGSLDKCLSENTLKVAGGGTQYKVGKATGDVEVEVKLPQGLACRRCLLQWKYNTGNSWGCDEYGCCLGCGPQEQFYNCADIGIYDSEETNDSGEIKKLDFHPPHKHTPTTTKPKIMSCEPSFAYQYVPGMETWCQNACPFCPKSHCICKYM